MLKMLGKEYAMIILDYRDKRPLYEQVGEKLQSLIVKGILEADSKMPSVRALAVELSINPNTIQRAYAELEANGYLYTVKGRGNYVSPDTQWKDGERTQVFSEVQKLVIRAESLGISEEELLAKIKECYRKAKETKEIKGKTEDREKIEQREMEERKKAEEQKEFKEIEKEEKNKGLEESEKAEEYKERNEREKEETGASVEQNVKKEERAKVEESMKKEAEHD